MPIIDDFPAIRAAQPSAEPAQLTGDALLVSLWKEVARWDAEIDALAEHVTSKKDEAPGTPLARAVDASIAAEDAIISTPATGMLGLAIKILVFRDYIEDSASELVDDALRLVAEAQP